MTGPTPTPPSQPPYQTPPQASYQPPQPAYGQTPPQQPRKGNIGWAVLGFLFPLVGLVLYLVWKDDRPGDANMAGKGALVSVIISVALMVILIVIYLICIAALAAGSLA